MWQHEAVLDWAPDAVPAPTETLDARLLAGVRAALAADPIVPTLADGHPNHVREITPDGIWVETERSRRLGRPPQLVPARMIQIAWEYLSAHGEPSNPFLLSTDGLNVKRSSFVCALLAQMPDVTVASPRPIVLRLSR